MGLACTYAGGVERAAVEQLRTVAGAYKAELAQGAAFAAKTRQRAGNASRRRLKWPVKFSCDLSSEDAAQVTDVMLRLLPEDGDVPAYEIWRQRIQAHFIQESARIMKLMSKFHSPEYDSFRRHRLCRRVLLCWRNSRALLPPSVIGWPTNFTSNVAAA